MKLLKNYSLLKTINGCLINPIKSFIFSSKIKTLLLFFILSKITYIALLLITLFMLSFNDYDTTLSFLYIPILWQLIFLATLGFYIKIIFYKSVSIHNLISDIVDFMLCLLIMTPLIIVAVFIATFTIIGIIMLVLLCDIPIFDIIPLHVLIEDMDFKLYLADPYDGTSVDTSGDILKQFGWSIESFDLYFRRKCIAIRLNHLTDPTNTIPVLREGSLNITVMRVLTVMAQKRHIMDTYGSRIIRGEDAFEDVSSALL